MPDFNFIQRFLGENSSATEEQQEQLTSQLKQLQELISDPENSNILKHIEWLGTKHKTPQPLINLLHLCLMPFVARKQVMQEWYNNEINKLSIELTNVNKKIVVLIADPQVRAFRKLKNEYRSLIAEHDISENKAPSLPAIRTKIEEINQKIKNILQTNHKVKLVSDIESERDRLVKKQQGLLKEKENLSFPATRHPAAHHAIKFLDVAEDLFLMIPFASLIPKDPNDLLSDNPYVEYSGIKLNSDTIINRSLDKKNYYLHLDTSNNIFYLDQKKGIGADSPVMPNRDIKVVAVDTDNKSGTYNLDLELINQYLSTLHLIITCPALLNLHPDLINNHFQSIMSLSVNWRTLTGLGLLNEIDMKLLCPEVFSELNNLNPENLEHYQKIIDNYCLIEQKLAQLFTQYFPEKNTPTTLAEFKLFLDRPRFLSAVLALGGGSLLNNEELFSIDDIIKLIIPDDNTQSIIQKLSEERLLQICFYAPNKKSSKIQDQDLSFDSIKNNGEQIKDDIIFNNETLIKILLETSDRLSLSIWQILLLNLSDNEQCLNLFNHIKKHYPTDYIGLICDLMTNKGIKDTKLIALLYKNDSIKMGELYQPGIELNRSQKRGMGIYIAYKRLYFFEEKIKLYTDPLNKNMIKDFSASLKVNLFNEINEEVIQLRRKYGIKSINGKYIYTGTSEDKKLITNIFNQLRQILKDTTTDCSTIIPQIKTWLNEINREKKTSLLDKLFSEDTQQLKNFLKKIGSKLTEREKLFNNSSSEADLYYLLLTPHIYYNLTADELTTLFNRVNSDIMAQIITEFYGPEKFKSFPSPLNNNYLITFDDLSLILAAKNNLDLDDYNFLRFKKGFPTALPEGATYTGEYYVDTFPLSPEHQYQLEGSDITAGEGGLRSMYQYYLVNSPADLTRKQMIVDKSLIPISKSVNDLPYRFYLVPACGAKLLDPEILTKFKTNTLTAQEKQSNKDFIDSFQQFKARLQYLSEYFKDTAIPVLICGGAHYGNNHYVSYFIFRHLHKTHVLVVDPSADGPQGNNHKQKSKDKLRAIFQDIFPHCEFNEANITQQLRERSCGQNTLATLENAFATACTTNPLIKIKDGRLHLNESALWMNGNQARHLDYYLNAYFYDKAFVEKCYQMRELWNKRLMDIKEITYYTPDNSHYYPTETVFSTEEYCFYENVKNQNNSDINNQHLSIITVLLSQSEALNSDLMSEITQQFVQSFKLPDLNALSRIAARIRETSKNLGENVLDEITASGSIPLESLISQAITINLAPHVLEALNSRIKSWIDVQLPRQRISYNITAEQYLNDIMNSDVMFKEFYNRLSDMEKNTAYSAWLNQIDTKLTKLKIMQAKQEIKEYCSSFFYLYLNIFDNIDNFEAKILEQIVKEQNAPCHEAANLLFVQRELTNIWGLPSQLQKNIEIYINNIYQKIISFFNSNFNYNQDIIQQFYDRNYNKFDLSKGMQLSDITPDNMALHNKSAAFVELLLTICNMHFNQYISDIFQQQLSPAINTLLTMPEVNAALNELHYNQLIYLAAVTPLDNINQLALNPKILWLLGNFGQHINLPANLNDCPILLAFFIPTMQLALQQKNNEIFNLRYQTQFVQFINQLILAKLNNSELPLNAVTIEGILQTYPASDDPCILNYLRRNQDSILEQVNHFFTARTRLLEEIIKFYQLFKRSEDKDDDYSWLQFFVISSSTDNFSNETVVYPEKDQNNSIDVTQIQNNECIVKKKTNAIAIALAKLCESITRIDNFNNQQSPHQLITSTEANLNAIKMRLINWLKQQIAQNIEGSIRIDTRPMRQMLIEIMNIIAYHAHAKNKLQNLPYFILDDKTDHDINHYISTIFITKISESIEVHRLLEPKKVRALGLNINLDNMIALPKQQISIQQKESSMSRINPVIIGENHHLTLGCVVGTIDWWLSNNKNISVPTLIYDLNNIISQLPIDYSFNEILPNHTVNRIRKAIDAYQLQSKKLPSLNDMAYYLMKTQELRKNDVLSIRYIKYLLAQYKGNITPETSADLQASFNTENLNSMREFSKGSLFKNLRSSQRIKRLEKLMEKFEKNNTNNNNEKLSDAQLTQLTQLIKELLAEKSIKDMRYYFSNRKLTPADNLLIGIAQYIINQSIAALPEDAPEDQKDFLLRWLYPQLKDFKYPRFVCGDGNDFYEYNDMTINDILSADRILLDSSYIVDINWILNGFNAQGKLINPYDKEQLIQNDIYHILMLPHPKAKELVDKWLLSITTKYSVAASQLGAPLTKRALDTLFKFCRDAFFKSGAEGDYDANETTAMEKATASLFLAVDSWPEQEREVFLKHPVPFLNQDGSSALEAILTDKSNCITGNIKRIALVVYAYDAESTKALHLLIVNAIEMHLSTHPLTKLTTAPNNYYENITENAASKITLNHLANLSKQFELMDKNFYNALLMTKNPDLIKKEKSEYSKNQLNNSNQQNMR